MDIFDLRNKHIENYSAFARSFTKIQAEDILHALDGMYGAGEFWPDPLIQLNPRYKSGDSLKSLVKEGMLLPETADIFETELSGSLYSHQVDSIVKAHNDESYIVTTGTGSGKSMCFFIPVVDKVLRLKEIHSGKIKAIIIYPMNALANSQLGEINKFLESSHASVTVARYTGQETEEEREAIKKSPPDILLTNFMMMEYLLTRQKERDRSILAACDQLQVLALDELHTYRGRQGADVGMLIRRIRALNEGAFLCIGTSATMSSGTRDAKKNAVARVASSLFGIEISSTSIIDENLERLTDYTRSAFNLTGDELRSAIENGHPTADWEKDPLAIWIEITLGVQKKEDGPWERARPMRLSDAASKLAVDSGLAEIECEKALRSFLLQNQKLPGRNKFAFRLHQFLSGAGTAYSTLEQPGQRKIVSSWQQFHPKEPQKRLYSLHFCRECGQEYHPVWYRDEGEGRFEFRDIEDVPASQENLTDEGQNGFLCPISDDIEFDSKNITTFPEQWLTVDRNGQPVLKYKKYEENIPRRFSVGPDGYVVEAGGDSTGIDVYFIPGKFSFCLNCGDIQSSSARDVTRLASLSAEGRSSATSVSTLSILKWLDKQDTEDIKSEHRKLLGFIDNRQDAALQSGHFNDFVFLALLRGGFLYALEQAGQNGLTLHEFGNAMFESMNLGSTGAIETWLKNPQLRGAGKANAEQLLRDTITYRMVVDQKRGWRYTAPNLENLGLIQVRYVALDEMVHDPDFFNAAPGLLTQMSPTEIMQAYQILFDGMRLNLCLSMPMLKQANLEQIKNRSLETLFAPWGFSETEQPYTSRFFELKKRFPAAGNKNKNNKKSKSDDTVSGGFTSFVGNWLRYEPIWGQSIFQGTSNDYFEIVQFMLQQAQNWGYVESIGAEKSDSGEIIRSQWQLNSDLIRFYSARPKQETNRFFTELYDNVRRDFSDGKSSFFKYEAREHTAQVDKEKRELREFRFRFDEDAKRQLTEKIIPNTEKTESSRFLPVMYCSPTMELGVDISELNVVYMRNVPPTPANYTQRGGRAGRGGSPAYVATYAAAKSPHDQYYFHRQDAMVQGTVVIPPIEIANEDLLRAHMHAIWLGSMGVELSDNIPGIIELIPELEEKGIYEIHEDIKKGLNDSEGLKRARERMHRFLDPMNDVLIEKQRPWYESRDAFTENVLENAYHYFDRAFDRWRHLFQSALELRNSQQRILNRGNQEPGYREAKSLHDQALNQLVLLRDGPKSNDNHDFYTYRYLATEGFLPGYNFPRLPLSAYIPGTYGSGRGGHFVQRPRFLGISEFGPRSLIYHEGQAYRVVAANLQNREYTDENTLVQESVRICKSCGAAHYSNIDHEKNADHCLGCGSLLTDHVFEIHALHSIDAVRTRIAERITANDEERTRQGFDILTTFRWAKRTANELDVDRYEIKSGETILASLNYGAGAEIARLNLGLKRRKNKLQHGFKIDPSNGRWHKFDDEPEDTTTEKDNNSVTIVPVVRERKNLLLVLFPAEFAGSNTTIPTVQYALKRAIERHYQIEESELMTEPVPDSKDREGFLLYEAAEGGAGVLSQLLESPGVFATIASAALKVLHFTFSGENPSEIAQLNDAAVEECVAACYQCTLSYYNQMEHGLLDRRDDDAKKLLLLLASSQLAFQTIGIGVTQQELNGLNGQAEQSSEFHGVPVLSVNQEERAVSVKRGVDASILEDKGYSVTYKD